MGESKNLWSQILKRPDWQNVGGLEDKPPKCGEYMGDDFYRT